MPTEAGQYRRHFIEAQQSADEVASFRIDMDTAKTTHSVQSDIFLGSKAQLADPVPAELAGEGRVAAPLGPDGRCSGIQVVLDGALQQSLEPFFSLKEEAGFRGRSRGHRST